MFTAHVGRHIFNNELIRGGEDLVHSRATSDSFGRMVDASALSLMNSSGSSPRPIAVSTVRPRSTTSTL